MRALLQVAGGSQSQPQPKSPPQSQLITKFSNVIRTSLTENSGDGRGSVQLPESGRYVLDEESQRLVRIEDNQCDICFRVLSTKNSLKMHYRSHTGERPYKCGECEMAFTKRGDLGRHLLIHANAKPFPCLICGVSFRQSAHLKQHTKRHFPRIKRVFCRHSPRVLSNPSAKPTHPRHAHTRLFAAQEATLTAALSVLELDPEEPLRCVVCRALFSTPSNLKRHQLTHTRERPYKCGECGVGFSRTDYLSRHALSHSQRKPLACPDCGQSFRQSSHLKRHARKRHGQGHGGGARPRE
ncbi:hypothetical protein FOCC_FOCC005491 [Frankliniella occidentalis]|nr:hypothetical protein FOCC_FOCC005491 [Frankliniella occidentalis]